jgi:hypothetical protein
MNFIRRWSACGDTRCRIVHVNTLADPGHIDTDAVMLRIMEERAAEAPARAKRKQRILGIKGAERAGEQAERAVDGHLAQ